MTVYDDASSRHEERWFTLGFNAGGNLPQCRIPTEITGPANIRIRIISARKATKRERRNYEDKPG